MKPILYSCFRLEINPSYQGILPKEKRRKNFLSCIRIPNSKPRPLPLTEAQWKLLYYTFELLISEASWPIYQILCVASVGWGKGCIRFWGRLDQNSGFHGNRKPPMTYNGENDVSTFSQLFLIRSFLYLQVTRTCIKSRTSSTFGQFGPLTTELAALEV